ncbi:MAG: type III-A CRISPR-associated RAMP protein Csm3 [Acidobacteriaceae bacterium]|nr:type III-A CRISPR-associated RAMP protein Csm3 [Acidobacteriaceae bacterium]MBV9780156.1 type III-A CRISPR-associated RAMP protein Csm3 [Acidobacteriaceae bacterium]
MSSHTASTELTFLGKLVLEGEIQCQTGLHIGAGKGSLEIGGADNPVVKDAFGIPYIPGSSLRGRLRSLLEQTLGLATPQELVYLSKRRGQEVRIHQSDRPDDDVCVLFGRNSGRVEKVSGEALEGAVATPARLTVYDAPLLVDSITPQMRENLDDELTEVKSENAVDRITSQANPRTLERVPSGARFHFRIVLDVLCEEDKPLLARVAEGLRLLEDDALGGGGSRGSGRVGLSGLKLNWRSKDYYSKGAEEIALLSGAELAALQQLASAEDFASKLT